MPYATRKDVYLLGLDARAFEVRPRPVQPLDVDLASGTIRLKAHGLDAIDVINLEVTSGGSLPTGLSAFVNYSPFIVSGDLFRIVGFGSYMSAGSGWGVVVDGNRRLDAHLAATAAEIDEHLTAHDVPIPLDPITGVYPQVLVALNARMAARAAVLSLQVDNARYKVAIDVLREREDMDKVLLADWKSGKPVQPRPVDGTVEANMARASSTREALDWTNGRLA